MTTSRDFTDDPENVNYLIKWWVTRERYRYHLMRCRGELQDFQQEVWCSILQTFRNSDVLDFSLGTIVINHCHWVLHRHVATSRPSWRLKQRFQARMRMARPVCDDDRIDYEIQPCVALENLLLHETIVDLTRTLTRRESIVIKARFGIGIDEMTLEEIGQELLISRERVRQIESKALGKLKHYKRANRLLPFIPERFRTEEIDELAAKQMQSTELGKALFEELTKTDSQ